MRNAIWIHKNELRWKVSKGTKCSETNFLITSVAHWGARHQTKLWRVIIQKERTVQLNWFHWLHNYLRKGSHWDRQATFNPLWPNYALWSHKSGPTLAQVMDWCLMASSYYMIQYRLIIHKILQHSSEGSFTGNSQDVYVSSRMTNSRLQSHLTGANELYIKLYGWIYLTVNP